MRTEDVLEHLHTRPFEPFRIHLSDGTHFDVRHPDLCMVSRSTFYVGVPDRRIRGAVMRMIHCSLLHVTRIEPVNGHAAGGKGGKRRRGQGE